MWRLSPTHSVKLIYVQSQVIMARHGRCLSAIRKEWVYRDDKYMQTNISNRKSFFSRFLGGVLAIILLVAIGFTLNFLFASRSAQTHQAQQPASQPQSPSLSAAISLTPTNASQNNLTARWNTSSSNRTNISFTFKYPTQWTSPYEYCIKPTSSNTCIKIVIFTDNLPEENTPPDRDIILTSQTRTIVNGYKAKREVFSLRDSGPDTYRLWVYDNGKPFLLWLAWIDGSNSQKRTEFVQTLDVMASTLTLIKR